MKGLLPGRKRIGEGLGFTNLSLIALGVALMALYLRALPAESSYHILWFIRLALVQGVFYLVAVWLILRARASRSTLVIILVFAALFRLSILFDPPYLSDDMYRYVWDGRVQAAGVNPYKYVPADDALKHLRDEAIYPKINRKDYARTIYPPVAEMIYFAATRVSEKLTWMKAVLVGFEVVTLLGLMWLLASFDLPRQRVILYAWHPLLVWEIAGSAHIDAAAIAFITLALVARRRNMEAATGVALACAALVKLIPVVLFPALYRRWGWKMPAAFIAVTALAYLPYLSVGASVLGFLPGYAEEEGMRNGRRFFVLSLARKVFGEANVPYAAYVLFALLVLAFIVAWSFLKRERDEESFVMRAFAISAAFTVLLSPRYAWYFAWLVPFLCFAPLAPIIFLTAGSFVLYAGWLGEKPHQVFAFHSFLYLPFALLCALTLWRHRARLMNRRSLFRPAALSRRGI